MDYNETIKSIFNGILGCAKIKEEQIIIGARKRKGNESKEFSKTSKIIWVYSHVRPFWSHDMTVER